jgi:hypothetical protein
LRQADETTIKRFLQRDPDIVHGGESAPLHRLLAMLRHSRVVVAQEPKPKNSRQRFTDNYRRYLLQERGLADSTSVYFVRFAEQFLSDRFGDRELNLSKLTADDVTNFVQNHARQLGPGRARTAPINAKAGRYRPDDNLLAFLKGL